MIDLASELPKSSRLYYDFLHFSNHGAQAVAAILARNLCPFLRRRFPGHAAAECQAPP